MGSAVFRTDAHLVRRMAIIMDLVLVKMFATALAFSQVASPDSIKTQFDPVQDQDQVVQLLRGGCAQMRKAFDVEDLNLDDLIATAMDDSSAIAGGPAELRGIDIKDLHTAYRQFCKNETVDQTSVDLASVIEFYNRTLADLPDHTRLKGMSLPGASIVLNLKGKRFAEIYEPDHRRVSVALGEIPFHVQQAFIAAEDKRFYQHRGVDERALTRAFIGNLAQSGRPQGGSTITQQVVKNILVGEDLTFERKVREMILASRVENILSKAEILQLYLNSTFLGRGSWGIEMAARSYFGKSASELSLSEGALLAGITKGPNYFNPDRHRDRAKQRYDYVLTRMREDRAISDAAEKQARSDFPKIEQPTERFRGSYFADHLARELKSRNAMQALPPASYTVRSTLNPDLQHATELALQEGLARYEMDSGRMEFSGPELNLAQVVERLETENSLAPGSLAPGVPSWQLALRQARLPLYDVHWASAIVTEKTGTKKGDSIQVGLADGRILPLQGNPALLREVNLYDVVLIRIKPGKGKSPHAELRVRPSVQGAAVVIENKRGRILAMAGGFSYPLSQLNRATQSQRQPGSALKPLTYLAALQKGLQPDTFIRDEAITLPPINGDRKGDSWSPKNYDGRASGVIPMRSALQNSRNLATVNLLDGGIASNALTSLERICALAIELQTYKQCVQYYPFVLGAQPVRMVDLAVFYATIANEGVRPSPYAIETMERNGTVLYRHADDLATVASADAASFYQLKTMLQGVVEHGTASRIKHLAPYVAGKTGTTDDENDVWFVGFTNDVTVAVWVGYDNADGKRRTLGGGHTGGSVAVPIFEEVIQASWTHHAPKSLLNGPSPAAKQLLAIARGDEKGKRQAGLKEYFRRDSKGRGMDTRFAVVREAPSLVATFRPAAVQHFRRESQDWGWSPGSYWGWNGADGQDRSRRYVEDRPQFNQIRRRPPESSTFFQWR